jgi:hypothetical protein
VQGEIQQAELLARLGPHNLAASEEVERQPFLLAAAEGLVASRLGRVGKVGDALVRLTEAATPSAGGSYAKLADGAVSRARASQLNPVEVLARDQAVGRMFIEGV